MQDHWCVCVGGGGGGAERSKICQTLTTQAIFRPPRGSFWPFEIWLCLLLSADGTRLISIIGAINKRWKELFNQLLNRSSSVNISALYQFPEQPVEVEFDNPHSMDELKKALKQMSSGKAYGKDGILGEVCKALGEKVLYAFHSVIHHHLRR